MSWNSQNPAAIGHHDVATFAQNPEARFLKRCHRAKMIDPG
jgi:hypothetical protein